MTRRNFKTDPRRWRGRSKNRHVERHRQQRFRCFLCGEMKDETEVRIVEVAFVCRDCEAAGALDPD